MIFKEREVNICDAYPYGYLYIESLFTMLFNSIPNVLNINAALDRESAISIVQKAGETISIERDSFNKTAQKESTVVILSDGAILTIGSSGYGVIYYNDKCKYICDKLLEVVTPITEKAIVKFIITTQQGYDVRSHDLKGNPVVLEDNYNEDLIDKTGEIINQLSTTKSGIYLFYGEPGTGKSNYIKYLKTKSDKDFIFVPNNVAMRITSPEFMSFIVEHSNSVLIMEDAEELIVPRDGCNNSTISGLLNLSDGLLGQALNIQVVCTFNNSLKSVDKALLRKGRLINSYEFTALSSERSDKLLTKLGHNTRNCPMKLCDIYIIWRIRRQ